MKTIEISKEESVAIHNAVIFMANDLMEEIQEYERYVKDDEDVRMPYLKTMKQRWDMLCGIVNKVNKE